MNRITILSVILLIIITCTAGCTEAKIVYDGISSGMGQLKDINDKNCIDQKGAPMIGCPITPLLTPTGTQLPRTSVIPNDTANQTATPTTNDNSVGSRNIIVLLSIVAFFIFLVLLLIWWLQRQSKIERGGRE